MAWRFVRTRKDWRAHLLPLVWVGGYVLFMGTRWVMSVRYFLPIYPFLCLYAAWGLAELWKNKPASISKDSLAAQPRRASIFTFLRAAAPLVISLLVVSGTLVWATAFVNAVYQHDPTRVQATEWIFQNVPAPFNLTIEQAGIQYQQPVAAPDGLQITPGIPFVQSFTASFTGRLTQVAVPHAFVLASQGDVQLKIVIAADPEGQAQLSEAVLVVKPSGSPANAPEVTAAFHAVSGSPAGDQAVVDPPDSGRVEKGKVYYLVASPLNPSTLLISRTVIANENWDEGLPVPYDGYDPFGQFYQGVTMEVRWYDDDNKRKMFVDTINQADLILLPSQRSIWTTCRIPKTYPMTMEYYRALFDGRLGFDLAASFQAPLKIGPLQISDLGGTAAWGKTPALPLFNHNLLSAEEAFSVYDHPPVWIFKKRADFNITSVEAVLNAVDLSKVVGQSPRDASGSPCP
jgi:hypothetical protein